MYDETLIDTGLTAKKIFTKTWVSKFFLAISCNIKQSSESEILKVIDNDLTWLPKLFTCHLF